VSAIDYFKLHSYSVSCIQIVGFICGSLHRDPARPFPVNELASIQARP